MQEPKRRTRRASTLAPPRAFDKGIRDDAGQNPLTRRLLRALCLLAAVAWAPGTAAAQAPDEVWRTFDTEHFVVTYPERLEPTARRAAAQAERAYAILNIGFVEAPEGQIDLIVTDHTDQANGFATVLPSNRITVFATPPVQSLSLQYFDDWLELLITHELAHIFHLDRSHPLGNVVRKVFGRVPLSWPVFPEVMAPTWTIEGIATHLESHLTDSGRSKGTYHDMVLRTAALENAFEGIDQVSGESPTWPAGPRPYIYGSKFFDYLTETHGDTAVSSFVSAVQGQWIPFRLNSAAKDAFGTSLSEAWDAWSVAEVEKARAMNPAPGPTAPEPVLDHGRFALHPQTSLDGRSLLLARSDGRTNSQLRLFALDDDGMPISEGRKLTRTNGFATFSWLPQGGVVFAQNDFVDPYRTYSDLYRVDADGNVARITTRARLSQPSAIPEGTAVVAVEGGDSGARLVEVDLETGEVRPITERRPDELWASPRISPDGRWIAASRWRPGGYLDVVILDRDGAVVSEVTNDRASDTQPAWSPDGGTLVWSSDRNGVLNLFGASVDAAGRVGEVRQITQVRTGVTYPWVSTDGAWIYASVYHADGWDVERFPLSPERWFTPDPLDRRFEGGGQAAARAFGQQLDSPARPYRAGASLLPRYWIPSILAGQEVANRDVVGLAYGIETSGRDLVGRHSYALAVQYEPKGERFNGGVGYSFSGLGTPILGFSVGQAHDADPRIGVLEDSTRVQLFEVERFRSATVSATFPRVRRRTFTQFSVAGSGLWTSSELLDADLTPSQTFRLRSPEHTFVQGRASFFASNIQGHAYSVSGEDGLSLSATGRVRTELSLSGEESGVPGFDDSLDDLVGVVRAFKAFDGPGFARHVVAARVSGGVAGGPGADRFHFDVGGAAGQGESTGLGTTIGGSPLLFPLRGYGEDIRAGRYAWSASAEYRFPIAIIHRGTGMFPLYFDRLWGSVFFDAANAWGDLEGFDVPNPRRDALKSVGAELAVRTMPFWTIPLDVRFGVGVPLDDVFDAVTGAVVGSDPRFYVRLGRSF